MLRTFVKCAMELAKLPQCLLFSTVKGGMNILRSYLNCSTIVNWKTRKRTNTLKGSQRMGGGRIFLKTFRTSLFNEDLSNEPNFDRIHLTGQCLQELVKFVIWKRFNRHELEIYQNNKQKDLVWELARKNRNHKWCYFPRYHSVCYVFYVLDAQESYLFKK